MVMAMVMAYSLLSTLFKEESVNEEGGARDEGLGFFVGVRRELYAE